MTPSGNDPAGSGRRGGARTRWLVLAVLVGVLVAALGVSSYLLLDKGAGSDPLDRLDSLRDPAPSSLREREDALAAARTFVQRFNTYGPELLDAQGKMPSYAGVGDLMTAKFARVFADNVGYAEETVKQTGIDRKAEVYAVGVAAIDADSADVLVGGIVEFSYPDPNDAAKRVPFEPLRFRYDVSLVRQDGEWRVDDLDDLDDGLPSFGEASQPQTGVPAPSVTPTPGASPSPSASTPPSTPPSTEPSPSGGTTP